MSAVKKTSSFLRIRTVGSVVALSKKTEADLSCNVQPSSNSTSIKGEETEMGSKDGGGRGAPDTRCANTESRKST